MEHDEFKLHTLRRIRASDKLMEKGGEVKYEVRRPHEKSQTDCTCNTAQGVHREASKSAESQRQNGTTGAERLQQKVAARTTEESGDAVTKEALEDFGRCGQQPEFRIATTQENIVNSFGFAGRAAGTRGTSTFFVEIEYTRSENFAKRGDVRRK